MEFRVQLGKREELWRGFFPCHGGFRYHIRQHNNSKSQKNRKLERGLRFGVRSVRGLRFFGIPRPLSGENPWVLGFRWSFSEAWAENEESW